MDYKTLKHKPNIILILLDDLGWKDLVCYGSEFYETPNIDKMAAEGMRFTDAYAACPVCSPTRASILCGKYPATVGVTNWIGGCTKGKLLDAPYVRELPLGEKCIASTLRDGGYRTWHIGKWHLGGREYYPENHGFDVNIGGCSWGSPAKGYFSPYHIETLENGPEGEYLTDRLTDEAIKLIKNKDEDNNKREKHKKPFFMNLCYYAVHTPIQAKQEDIERFKKKAVRLGLDKVRALEEGEVFPCEHKKHLRVTRRKIQSDPVYAAMIYNLDWNVGRLIEALKDTNQDNDTVIMFTSDNGGLATSEGSPTCNFPLNEGKGWMYEGGVREPLIVRWPGVVESGKICEVPVTSPDFYPTFLEIAGLPLIPEQHTDGISFLPLLKGGSKLEREAIYWHYPHYGNQGGTPGSSIRMGDYKLIEFFEDGRVELYNLKEDLSENYDIAADNQELVRKLKEMLRKWRDSVNALIPELNPGYIPWG